MSELFDYDTWLESQADVYPVRCEDCEHWQACPECGHEGYCIEHNEWTRKDDEC